MHAAISSGIPTTGDIPVTVRPRTFLPLGPPAKAERSFFCGPIAGDEFSGAGCSIDRAAATIRGVMVRLVEFPEMVRDWLGSPNHRNHESCTGLFFSAAPVLRTS
ncbi:MAG: hypothetical protein NVS2B1_02120 [Bradyrhizobium sp.]